MDRERQPARRSARSARPPIATEPGLWAAACTYLERQVASRAHLRRTLWRKVERSGDEIDREAVEGLIGNVLDRLERAGAVDDGRYAVLRARAQLRKGSSLRAIESDLRKKGVDAIHVSAALAELREETADPEWLAACRLARRRRLGPFGSGDRAARRHRELAAMARAGFSFAIAQRVLDAPDAEPLLEALRGL